jgi:hypothetical protein
MIRRSGVDTSKATKDHESTRRKQFVIIRVIRGLFSKQVRIAADKGSTGWARINLEFAKERGAPITKPISESRAVNDTA